MEGEKAHPERVEEDSMLLIIKRYVREAESPRIAKASEKLMQDLSDYLAEQGLPQDEVSLWEDHEVRIELRNPTPESLREAQDKLFCLKHPLLTDRTYVEMVAEGGPGEDFRD